MTQANNIIHHLMKVNFLWVKNQVKGDMSYSQILGSALINANLGHLLLIYLMLVNAACKFS